MSAVITEYHTAHERSELERSTSFLAVDPGKTGFAIHFFGGKPIGVYPISDPTDSMFAAIDAASATQIVIEQQFMQGSPRDILRLSIGAGMLIGMCAGVSSSPDLSVVWVHPSTWFTAVSPGGKVERKRRKEIAVETAAPHLEAFQVWREANKAQREGMADAFCIGVWWSSQRSPGKVGG